MTLLAGDCIEVMRELDECSIDAVVTDPPYGLGFMGKEWDSPGGTGDFPMRRTDPTNTVNTGAARQGGRQRSTEDFARRQARDARSYQAWCESWATELLRVLKPGGWLLAFGGTRTYHRLAAGIEDAGFEIRDMIEWLYGSGFPKSLDVSKAIDKAAGHWRGQAGAVSSENDAMAGPNYERTEKGNPVTAAAAAAGYGTALKPAHEPVCVARKSLTGTVAENVMEHGTGALNIDGCRVATEDEWEGGGTPEPREAGIGFASSSSSSSSHALGRWPANVALDEEAAAQLDQQAGERKAGGSLSGEEPSRPFATCYGEMKGRRVWESYGDVEGPSRFFYCAKASQAERNAGLEGFPVERVRQSGHADERVWDIPGSHSTRRANFHPTVKPIDFTRWLVRLVTPLGGGLILDPFLGSGTTGIAALLEGVSFVGIEREAEYLEIAKARLAFWREHGEEGLQIVAKLEAAERVREEVAAAGQLDLFAEGAA